LILWVELCGVLPVHKAAKNDMDVVLRETPSRETAWMAAKDTHIAVGDEV
jgi:hypothetical protein